MPVIRGKLFIIGLIALGVIVPLLGYWHYSGQTPAMTAVEAFRDSPLSEQLALAGALLLIKPIYMLVALGVIVALWRIRSSDMTALRWGVMFFLAGETVCGLNIILFRDGSLLLEFLHTYGMMLSFAFVTYGMLEILDSRLVGWSDPQKKCALVGLCHKCSKYSDAACSLQRVFYFVIPILMLLSFIPLSASTSTMAYNTKVFGIFLTYSHPVTIQVFEARYAPIYALALFTAAFLTLLWKSGSSLLWTKSLFAAGTGTLGISLLQLAFFSIYRDNLVWAEFWEEATELVFVVGIAFFLWTFRSGLIPVRESASSSQGDEG